MIIFHSKNKTIPHFDFIFNNNDNSKVPDFKLLGVFLDENLTFNHHFCQIRNKISKSLYSFNRANYFLSAKSQKWIYNALTHFIILILNSIIMITIDICLEPKLPISLHTHTLIMKLPPRGDSAK